MEVEHEQSEKLFEDDATCDATSKKKTSQTPRVFSQNFPRLASAMPQAEGEAVMDDAAAAA
jgi:hypothetical protein